MRICVITGGPNIDSLSADIALSCDKVICADSGADFAFDNHILPAMIYGDLDSISDEGKMRIQDLDIPVTVFPAEKDMTDTELALSTISIEDEIILVCSLAGRIDHVMANLQIAMQMHERGYSITITDGVTDVIPLCGEEELHIEGIVDPENTVISLIAANFDTPVTGVTSQGLYYALDNASITAGNSLTVSNKLIKDISEFDISIKTGKLFVFITNNLI